MEHTDHCNPPESSSSDTKPEDLLEESWFFGNPLDKNTKKAILRCYSVPCPSSSSYSQEMLASNSSGGDDHSLSTKKVSSEGGFDHPPPSPPPCTVAREEEVRKEKAIMSKSILELREQNLLRAPSLPPGIGREEDVESDFALSKLIRQASLNSTDVLPPRRNSKVMKQTSVVSRHRERKNPEPGSIDMEACNDMRRLCFDQNRIRRKSGSDFESTEVRRFKELGFNFDKGDSNPSEDRSSAPPIPSWVDSKSSSAEDMKAQIKFWARAVAANVR
ncbi:uncharacterized protein LOC131323366 [Rhododendron vialii]|uniref:uncharacterized protein LOC131323366 n=1 Tax=Rhododendron vialii TaxID=182163 RepID=UPI00265EAF83|nr:uncharacterized protein LOC131323366 [Rhododendron vialii]